jgi:hypothetical protein
LYKNLNNLSKAKKNYFFSDYIVSVTDCV